VESRFSYYRCLILITLFLGSVSTSLAQSDASLHGTVIFMSGVPVAQATITVEGTGGGQAATTNASGRYSMSKITPGSYTVEITYPGYETFVVKVSLSDGADAEVDAVLTAEPTPPPAPTEAAPQTAARPPAAAPEAQAPQVTTEKGNSGISGVVTDPTGAVIPGATVTVTGASGTKTVTSNNTGHYVVSGLAPGTYKLKVTMANFAPFETDVTLARGQSLEISAGLLPPSAVENVNVTAGGPAQVETGTAHIEGTITEKEVLSTGLNGRNFTQLIALAPGVSNQTGQDEAKVGVAGSVKYSVNGGRVEYNNFDVDGSDVLNAGLNGAESTLMVYPSLDAIKEVKVLTSNYGAQYGRTASGTVLVTTKSGEPQFHGGAYDFVRNEFFNARNYFDPPGKAPLYRRQDFGFTLGGPIDFRSARKRAFFFWSEEFRLEKSPLGPGNEPGDFNQAVPTLTERAGDFSDVCPFVFPGTVVPVNRVQYPDCPSFAGSTFYGNQLGNLSPSSNTPALNPNSVSLMNALIPAPNAFSGCNSSLVGQVNVQTGQPFEPCYVAAVSPPTYWREELGRADYNISDHLRASFRYIHDAWDTTTTVPQWDYLQTAAVHAENFPSVENRFLGPGISLVANITANSSTLVNEFVASYVDSHITLTDESGPVGNLSIPICRGLNPCSNGGPATGIGYIFGTYPNGYWPKSPGIIVGGTNGEYGGNGFAVDTSYMPWNHTNPTYSLADNVTKALGPHTLQVGMQVVDAQRKEINGAIGSATGETQGLLGFTNLNGAGTGNAFADFLTASGRNAGNYVSSFQQDSGQLTYYNNYWILEPYVQDDWRATHRLTVNLGVRFSLFTNYHEKNLNAYNWDPAYFDRGVAANVSITPPSGLSGGGTLLYNGQPVTVGTNSPLINGVMQCGKNGIPDSCMSGHFFNPAPRVGFAWDPKGDGKTSIRGGYGLFYEHGTAKESNTGSLEGGPPLVLTMTQPNPFGGFYGIDGGVFPIDVSSIPTKTIWSYVQQWSLSVQRQLPKDMVGTVAYVGSKGTHLSAELQLNQLTPPPTGPDTGIFPTGNPFAPGQPITAAICDSYGGLGGYSYTDANGYQIGTFTVGNIVVTPPNSAKNIPGQPAWANLAAACYALNPVNGGSGTAVGIPFPSYLQTIGSVNGFAPGMGRVLSLQNIADSQYHALQTTLRRTRGPLTLGVSYTYSHSLDDASDRSDTGFVNSANIRQSWASSNFDQRHLLSLNYIYSFRKLSGTMQRWMLRSDPSDDETGTSTKTSLPAQGDSRILRAFFDGWEFSGITSFQSGTPFSVINAGSSNGISVPDNAGVANGAGVGSYPDVIGNPRAALPVSKFNASSVGPLLYNPAAFAAPQGLTFGDAGRNFLTNPHRLNFDMSLFKNFKVTESSAFEFRAEAFNIFNHTQFRIYNPNIGNTGSNVIGCYGGPFNSALGGPTPIPNAPPGTPDVNVDCTTGTAFLRPVDSHRPRTLQFGLKYNF